jgi:hypothetical protein
MRPLSESDLAFGGCGIDHVKEIGADALVVPGNSRAVFSFV